MSQTATDKIQNWTQAARRGARSLARATSAQKNRALRQLAQLLRTRTDAVLAANARDVEASQTSLSGAALDRLKLDHKRIQNLAGAVDEIIALPDPVGECGPATLRPNGLRVMQMNIPLGVILMIFESRPNVAIDAGALCLKSGNAVILRGGKESIHTCSLFGELFAQALQSAGLDAGAVTIVDDPDRALVAGLLSRSGEIDLVIPRGGESLIRAVTEQSRIPVIQHFQGICHTYIHRSAEPQRAVAIAINGKVQRPGVCNATETILVDRDWQHTPALLQALHDAKVEIRGCEATRKLAAYVKPATEQDWHTEYLDLIVSVRIVDDLEQALQHIETYNSNHTEAIVATDWDACSEFQRRVQSSTVCINASTRFADGGELGLGAEIGISTSKLHAYGPMGLRELTTRKFVVLGNGQVRT